MATAGEHTGATDPHEGEAPLSLAEAQRIRHQAVRMAERMLREVMGSSGDASGGLETWQEAAMLRAMAEEEMEFAREESRRLPAIAAAERDDMRARYAQERRDVRAELQRELQTSRAAAADEAERIRSAARAEAKAILTQALGKADSQRIDKANQLDRMERRMAVLQTALADAESRFRRLAATAANEIGTLAAIADQDVVAGSSPSRSIPDPTVTEIDLTDAALRRMDGELPREIAQQESGDAAGLKRDPEVGFYQRRLAGLRDRL
ncbi:MAG: hypothetical protein QNJ77_10050, partial [Acidimicrobiia bacterium]|nr:hypothetical protein [Acidimicrobiia bacterium]